MLPVLCCHNRSRFIGLVGRGEEIDAHFVERWQTPDASSRQSTNPCRVPRPATTFTAAPVAMPPSATIAVRPAISTCGRSPSQAAVAIDLPRCCPPSPVERVRHDVQPADQPEIRYKFGALTVGDCSDRQLLLLGWRTGLADQFQVERSLRNAGDLVAKRHGATRECHRDRMPVLVRQQSISKTSAGFAQFWNMEQVPATSLMEGSTTQGRIDRGQTERAIRSACSSLRELEAGVDVLPGER
jgi:hypothetical protein